MENHGFPFEERWLRLEEHVRAMKACWTQKDADERLAELDRLCEEKGRDRA